MAKKSEFMIKKLLIKAIKFYQRNISARKAACCRFYPTCSEYGLQAIELHGVVKGLFLAFFRILRCNPLFKGGYDPVPENFLKGKKTRGKFSKQEK